MYMDYSKLWKLLVDKGLCKTDLIEITGISSRVLAKLSKNETVTTDTLIRICAALSCDISDIAECVSDNTLSIYAAFKKHGVCVAENDTFKTICFTVGTQKYTVYQSQERATKATQIHCEQDGTVYWEQLYPVGYVVMPVKKVLIKPRREESEMTIVLIKGKPAVIAGLDENGFVSSRGIPKRKDDVYVMSEAAFKIFAPK